MKDEEKYNLEAVAYVRLKCPTCGSLKVPVQHTDPPVDNIIVRRHKCENCGICFKSTEIINEANDV